MSRISRLFWERLEFATSHCFETVQVRGQGSDFWGESDLSRTARFVLSMHNPVASQAPRQTADLQGRVPLLSPVCQEEFIPPALAFPGTSFRTHAKQIARIRHLGSVHYEGI